MTWTTFVHLMAFLFCVVRAIVAFLFVWAPCEERDKPRWCYLADALAMAMLAWLIMGGGDAS